MRMKKLLLTFGAIMIALALTTTSAHADCGDSARAFFKKQAWNGVPSPVAKMLLVSDEDEDGIVGMWHVTFTAKGNVAGPPDGTPIDNALVTWHSDHTELMNSARPPQDGQFCMGVWQRTGATTYKLNHFAWSGNDTANAPYGIGNPAGPTHFVEHVTLSSDHNHYSGTFTLDAYDTNGNVVAHIVGVIHGTRITVNTTTQQLL